MNEKGKFSRLQDISNLRNERNEYVYQWITKNDKMGKITKNLAETEKEQLRMLNIQDKIQNDTETQLQRTQNYSEYFENCLLENQNWIRRNSTKLDVLCYCKYEYDFTTDDSDGAISV